MTLQSFRDLLSQRPFKPFRFVMANGREYDVHNPEEAFLTRESILVGIDIADDGVPADFRICPLLNVAAVEPLSIATSEPI